jgi:very-short-patch-repair endonuclease
MSDQHKQAISNGKRGIRLTDAHKRAISESHKGKTMPEHVKEILRIVHNGRKCSENTKIAMSAWQKGKVLSEEHRRAISIANTGHVHSEEHRKKIGNWSRGKKWDTERKQKASKTQKARYAAMTKEERWALVKKPILAALAANPSSIEWLLAEVLNKFGKIVEHNVVFGYFIVDFWLPEHNLIIECNGDYWHNLPKRVKRDRQLTTWCKNRHINLIFVWEYAIKENPQKALLDALYAEGIEWGLVS